MTTQPNSVIVRDRGGAKRTVPLPQMPSTGPVIDVPSSGITNTSEDSHFYIAVLAFVVWGAAAFALYQALVMASVRSDFAFLFVVVFFVGFAVFTMIVVTGHLPGILAVGNERLRIKKQASLMKQYLTTESNREENRHVEAMTDKEIQRAQIMEQNATAELQRLEARRQADRMIEQHSMAHIDMVPERNQARADAARWLQTLYTPQGFNGDNVHASGAIKRAPWTGKTTDEKRELQALLVGENRPLEAIIRGGKASGYTLRYPTAVEALEAIKR